MLYSTTCKLELDIKENKPSCVYKLVDGNLVKQ